MAPRMEAPLRVLIIDDDLVDAMVIRRLLERMKDWRLTLCHATGVASVAAACEGQVPDIAFVDYRLGRETGIQAIKDLGRQWTDTAFILMTGQGDEHVAAEAMRAGALDYLLKQELSAEGLERSLRYAVDRLASRRALQASEARFRSVAHSATEAIVISDIRGVIVSWNAGAERMFGYGEDEILGRTADCLMPEAYRARHDEGMNRFVRTGEARVLGMTQEYEGLHKDGTAFPVELSLSSWTVGPDRYFSAIIRDVTDRKRAESRLRQSEALLRAVIDTALDCIVTIDHEGRVREFNPAAERTFGYKATEAVGRDLAELIIPPSLREKHHEGLRRFRETGEGPAINQRLELNAMRADGTEFPVELAITAIKSDGPPVFTGYLRDITERKDTERDLALAYEEAKRSNADLQQFAYSASHDLQEPLRMIGSYLQLLERRAGERLTPEEHEFLGFAVDAAARMKDLIRDLLAYSRITTRGLEPLPVGGDEALQAALTNLKVAIDEAEAQITHDGLPTILGDEPQLTRLFQNLVGNAIKYRSPGKRPVIHVGAARRGDVWEFSVKDNGIGIEEKYFDQIFAIFQRLHTRTEYSGTGVGLAICKKIVERHGGRIWLESSPGKGSTFFFTLPAEVASDTHG